jgi:hypothetical protein
MKGRLTVQSERAVPWTDLTSNDQARFASESVPGGADARKTWDSAPVAEQWRFYASCLEARIAQAPDGVALIANPLAVDPSHRAQHVCYSASLSLCVQRKGRFTEKTRNGKRVGWERRGEEILVGTGLPTDLSDMLVIPGGQ